MSFCTDVKNELAAIRPPKHCKPPLVYGFLLFGRSFAYRRISMQTTNQEMALYYVRLLREVYQIDAAVISGGGSRKTYRVAVESDADRLRILASFDYGIYDGEINRELIPDASSAAAFVRGAFLACGNLSDPNHRYSADFLIRNEALAHEFQGLLAKFDIQAGLSKRGNAFVVTLRRNETVGNLLTFIGASTRNLEMIETTVIKSVKNKTNRARNCDSANIGKTVEASIRQREAIDYLEKIGCFSALPEPLIQAAELRRNNPNASLHELCRLSSEPITVSGLNHRLKRLLELYEEHKPQN